MLNLAIAALLILPQTPATGQSAPAPTAQTGITVDNLFPAPSGPLTLEISDPENEPTVADLVSEYCRLTGQNAITTQETKSLLAQHRLHLIESLTVPAEEVQHTFELLLRQNDFCLMVLKKDGVRLIQICSMTTSARNNLRAGALHVTQDQLEIAEKHPAMIFTTVVTLPNTDVRQVSNSMRTMITDANTQQMLPAGNSNSMVLVGFGDLVSALAEMLKTIDASSAIGASDRTPLREMIRLEHAAAPSVATLLLGAFGVNPDAPNPGDPKILSDARTNSLIVVAPPKRMADIKEMIASLDTK